jgi:PIN domain nuclease of toxin-antitoxin system
MSIYVTDTHPLVWHAADHPHKLSRKVLRIFREAEEGRALVLVPALVLWEITLLIRAGKIKLSQPFADWMEMLFLLPGFELVPLDPPVIAEAMQVHFTNDPFDAAIVSTALIRNLPLITKDQSIIEAGLVKVAW